MTLCDRCDRVVTADTVCSIFECPHKDITLRAPTESESEDVATVTFDDSDDAPQTDSNTAPDHRPCHACGAQNDAVARFCAACGTTMAGGTADVIDQRNELPVQTPEFRNIALGVAAVLIIGLLAFLAFGQEDSSNNAAPDKPVVITEAKPAKPVGQETVMWTVTDAIVREKPTTKNSKELGKLPRGTKLNGILQMGSDGQSKWLWLADGSGYVGAIILSQNEPPKLVKILGNQTWYAPDAVAIYALPDSASPQIATIPQGQKIRLAGITENGFAEAELKKGVGYIAAGSYDFSVSTPPLSNAGDSDVADFYTAMGLNSTTGPYIFNGTTADQIIRLTIWSTSPKGEIAGAEYRNSRTGNTCSSYMNLIGRDEKGRFRFNQITAPKGNACQIYTDVVLSPSNGYVNAWWMQGDQIFMSAKLRMN